MPKAAKVFDPYRGRDPREVPTYSVMEVAHYLWVPQRTLQTWVHGYSFQAAGRRKHQLPVIPVDSETGLLSFADLLELHVLAALRREHGVVLDLISPALPPPARSRSSTAPESDDVRSIG